MDTSDMAWKMNWLGKLLKSFGINARDIKRNSGFNCKRTGDLHPNDHVIVLDCWVTRCGMRHGVIEFQAFNSRGYYYVSYYSSCGFANRIRIHTFRVHRKGLLLCPRLQPKNAKYGEQ